MKALSIRQPWAWLIIHGGKNIENRSWHTKFRGRFLVHASMTGMSSAEYEHVRDFVRRAAPHVVFPPACELMRGGIIGSVELIGSLDSSDSPWYMGEKAFLLRNPEPLPFRPYKGRLQFFDVPDAEQSS
jgi:hypothetical protein